MAFAASWVVGDVQGVRRALFEREVTMEGLAREERLVKRLANRCPKCFSGTEKDEAWRPGRGLDPRMRRYICVACGVEVYVVGRWGFKPLQEGDYHVKPELEREEDC